MKTLKKIMLLMCFSIFIITACENGTLDKPELIDKLLDDTITATQNVIKEHDIKKAREIWGQISEYGVKAKELEKTEMAEDLNKLAATYAYLIEYFETKDPAKLDTFNKNFDLAIEQLKDHVRSAKTK